MPLKVFAWNSHSVKPKLAELSHFVDFHLVDIILLSETWLKDNEIFYLHSFECYRVDRPYGGVAILIKKKYSPCFFEKKFSRLRRGSYN